MSRVPVLPPAWGVVVVCLGTLIVPFDSAVNVAFPAIIRAFALPIPAIQWVVIAYTLTYAALMLVFGRVGDILGHRRVFLFGTGCSAAAFLGCAAAPSYAWLLAARVAQGVGAALALSCGPALATGLYPESQRARILGVYTMVFGAGSAAGSLLAGVLVAWFGWPSVFWFRAPLSLAAFICAWGLPVAARSGPPERFDAAGAGLLVLATGALLLGLNRLHAGRWPAVPPGVCPGGSSVHPARTPRRVPDHRSGLFSRRGFCLVERGQRGGQPGGVFGTAPGAVLSGARGRPGGAAGGRDAGGG